MSFPVRIVGQGLAGSLLAWECERAGIEFHLFDLATSPSTASQVAAGILNPITGQRLVKSWRVAELLPAAIQTYREMEDTLGGVFLFPMRVHRFYREEREREVAIEKKARGDLDPYVRVLEADGFWIESAYRLDTADLINRLRERWRAKGKISMVQSPAEFSASVGEITIWCLGAGELTRPAFAFAQLSAAKGQILRIESAGLEPGVILNDGHWLLPVKPGHARVGATYERDDTTLTPTVEARRTLEMAARRFVGRGFAITGQDVGVRVTTPDKHPVVGRDPRDPRSGVINGLGSKGGLLAPWLARQWVAHLARGAAFDPAVDVARYAR